jgi:serine/threonine protein kinase
MTTNTNTNEYNFSFLSSGYNGQVYADEIYCYKEVDSMFNDDGQNVEYGLIKFANNINGLVVKSFGYSDDEVTEKSTIILERLYNVSPLSFTVQELQEAINVAKLQLDELHQHGWAHGDIKRPSTVLKVDKDPAALYNNVFITLVESKPVIRLIDCGLSIIDADQLDWRDFEHCKARDLVSWKSYCKWLLGLPRENV